ncbi:magnesium transporter CorA family protein [Mycoplasmatota bacterium]|nr:magnesium transporter CorA family protein [Mycoplasmatota bacterium]
MLTYYKTNEQNQLEQLDDIQDGAWINLVKPTQEEIETISTKLNIDENDIKSVLDAEETARIETEDDYTLIIVDVPTIEREENSEFYMTIPLAIIVTTSNHIITVCLNELQILNYFIENKVKGFFTYKRTRFIYQILFKNAALFLQYLRLIDRQSSRIEKELHKSLKNKELIQLLDLEKSLVFFSTSLRSNEVVLDKLHRVEHIKHYPEDEELLEDVIIENKQAIEMSNIYSGILSGMMDAFASVISNNLNMVMKTLTSITIVLAIPTLIASLFGMNVPLPFSDNSIGLLIIVILSFTVALIVAIFMRKKNLF